MTRYAGRIGLVVFALAGSAWPTAQTRAPRDAVYDAIRMNDMVRLRALVLTRADANASDEGYTRLMDAAASGSVDAVKFLIDKGADVNAQSETGLDALMLSVGDLPKERLLLERGAQVNAATKLGRTAVFLAAMRDPSAAEVRFLVSKGADLKITDAFKNTLLSAAAAGNDTETIRMMLDAGINVNAAAVTGMTPLILSSAQRNVEAVKLLLAKGANANAVVDDPGMAPGRDPKSGPVTLRAYTPLLSAAAQGPPELIRLLLDAGANVNATESRKLTPLMIAVASDHQDADVIKLLLSRGADPAMRGTQAGTAAEWATKIGAPAGIQLLHAAHPQPSQRPAAAAPLDLRTAVERSVSLMETSSQGFFEKSACVSCHAQSMTDMAVAEARLKGLHVNEKAAADRIRMVETAGFPGAFLHERMDIRVPEIIAYEAAGLAAVGRPADRLTDAISINIAASQSRDGAWHQLFAPQERPGGEDGDVSRTALCVRVLAVYGPKGRAAEMSSRIARAREWLAHVTPVTQEDSDMQLLGLSWAGASAASTKPIVAAILAAQQSDGGWRQREGLGTDAYATGESLYALAKAGGVAPSDPAYQKGVRYLLATERPSDGSWRVESRSPKFQTFFQSGFPYAGDQWISQWATGWASMALAQAIPLAPTSAMK